MYSRVQLIIKNRTQLKINRPICNMKHENKYHTCMNNKEIRY